MILSTIAPTCPVMLDENKYVCKKQPAVNSFSCEGEQVGLQQAEGIVNSTGGVEARMPRSQSQFRLCETAWVLQMKMPTCFPNSRRTSVIQH